MVRRNGYGITWQQCGQRLSWQHEIMRQYFIKSQSLSRVSHQDALDEISSLFRNFKVGEVISIVSDIFIGTVNCLVLEGWFPNQHCKNDHSQRPDIHFVTVTHFLQNLRSNVIWCATDSLPLFTHLPYPSRKTKITNLCLHVTIQ